MQFKFTRLVQIPPNSSSKQSLKRSITSSTRSKVAACTDTTVHLYDVAGNYKDKFPTKSVKEASTHQITVLAYSPDETKLAVGQSDGGLFVYKLGAQWGEKKSICNKFIISSSIMHVLFYEEFLIFSSLDGKVYLGALKSNKIQIVHEPQESSYLPTFLCGNELNIFCSYTDGSVFRFAISGPAVKFDGQFYRHISPVSAMTCVDGVLVMAALDKKIIAVENGVKISEFDCSSDPAQFEFTHVSSGPSFAVFASKDRLTIVKKDGKRWTENSQLLEGLSVVSNMTFSSPFLHVASINGTVYTFEVYSKKIRAGKYYITESIDSCLISPVLRDNFSKDVLLKSNFEFKDVRVYLDQFVVAFTSSSLVIHDIKSGKSSEVPWTKNGSEKFYFGHPNYSVVHLFDEASIIKLGDSKVSSVVNTSNVKFGKLCISDNGIAYINNGLFLQLNNGIYHEISHPVTIDFVELSSDADFLLFRDKGKALYIYDIALKSKQSVCGNASFFCWIPGCSVFIVQSRMELLICYTPSTPTAFSKHSIDSNVVTVEKFENKTRVVIGTEPPTYVYLDDTRTDFAAALEKGDLKKAAILLESIDADFTHWEILLKSAVKSKDLLVMERCYAGMCDISGVRFISAVRGLVRQLKQMGIVDPMNHYTVRAQLALHDCQFKIAETLFLDQGKIQDAMDMYQEIHKWDLAIQIAEFRNHPDIDTLKANYFNWLVNSFQYDQAALIREKEGNFTEAIKLYLKGAMPVRAAKTLLNRRVSNSELAKEIVDHLVNSGLFEQAGEILISMNSHEEAYEMFKRGKHYRQAVDLARKYKPENVVALEEIWAEHLLSRRQTEAAVNHFLEAGNIMRAVQVASDTKQWRKLSQILESQDGGEFLEYFKKLGDHYRVTGDFDRAESYYSRANLISEIVTMFTTQKLWQRAWKAGLSKVSEDHMKKLFFEQAKTFESAHLFKDAEAVYVTMGEVDDAITMYKDNRAYDNMIRLVTIYHRDLLVETFHFIAEECLAEKDFREAEKYFVEANEWKDAVAMYCKNSMFEDAFRVAKTVGGASAAKQVAYLWAKSLSSEAAFKLLEKQGTYLSVLEFALENKDFAFAVDIAVYGPKNQLQAVHEKHAAFLEAEGKYPEAQDAFIKAGNAKEAVLMHINAEDWNSALSTSERYIPAMLNEVLLMKGKHCFKNGEYTTAVSCLIRAQRADTMISLYQEAGMIDEALRFAHEHLPAKVPELQKLAELGVGKVKTKIVPSSDLVLQARSFEQKQEYDRAIDSYLKMGPQQAASTSDLEAVWMRAIEIAFKFVPTRAEDITKQVADRLLKIQQFKQASKLYLSLDNPQKSAEILVQANLWEDAREISSKYPSVRSFIENSYVEYLKNEGQGDELVNVDIVSALEFFVQRGQWDKCLEKASSIGGALLEKYMGIYCDQMTLSGKLDNLIDTFGKYGPLQNPREGFYESLCKTVLAQPSSENLATLSKILKTLKAPPGSLKHFMDAIYLTNLKERIREKKDLKHIVAKLSVSLARFVDIIPSDRVFYDAGLCLIDSGKESSAFVFWNRYLDLADAIDEKKNSVSISGTEFIQSDFPKEWILSPENLDETKREAVRDWILSKSLDQNISHHVPIRKCTECEQGIIEASLSCPHCGTFHEPCIVSGFPIVDKSSEISCECGGKALRDDWYTFIMSEKKCPKCERPK